MNLVIFLDLVAITAGIAAIVVSLITLGGGRR